MTLKEMAVSYRLEADRLRHRIQLVRELPVRTEMERTAKIERLRLLEAMRRDVREVAVICERYYDPTFHKNERYSL